MQLDGRLVESLLSTCLSPIAEQRILRTWSYLASDCKREGNMEPEVEIVHFPGKYGQERQDKTSGSGERPKTKAINLWRLKKKKGKGKGNC